jgi:hypothetical protein
MRGRFLIEYEERGGCTYEEYFDREKQAVRRFEELKEADAVIYVTVTDLKEDAIVDDCSRE